MEPKRTCCKTCPYYRESYKEHLDRPVFYCTGKGKNRMRRIGKKDRASSPPEWCPRYITPPKLRVYAIREDYMTLYILDRLDAQEKNRKIYPAEFRYELRMETESPVSAYHLYHDVRDTQTMQSVYLADVSQMLGTEVRSDEVLEIDDGINPVFFYLDTLPDFDLRPIRFDKEKMK